MSESDNHMKVSSVERDLTMHVAGTIKPTDVMETSLPNPTVADTLKTSAFGQKAHGNRTWKRDRFGVLSRDRLVVAFPVTSAPGVLCSLGSRL